MGGMSTAEMAAAAYPAAGTEAALGSGMTGMGLEAATPALTGVGAAEAGAGIGGMSAAEMAAAAWPEVGSTVAGGAGGTLGSGLYGTGVADIGAAMGTVGDIGSGLGSMGDLSSILNGNYLGDYGVDSYYPQPSNSFVQSAPTDMDPYANETAKFMRQDAMQPGEYWDKNLTMPTVDTSSSSWLENQIKKQGTDLIKNQIKQALTPSQQGARPPAGATSYATTAPLPSTGAPASMGALQQVTQQRQAPMGGSPVDSNYSRMEQELRRQLRDSRYTTSNSGMDFMPLNNLQNNNGDATLAGYELWKALNQPSNQR